MCKSKKSRRLLFPCHQETASAASPLPCQEMAQHCMQRVIPPIRPLTHSLCLVSSFLLLVELGKKHREGPDLV